MKLTNNLTSDLKKIMKKWALKHIMNIAEE